MVATFVSRSRSSKVCLDLKPAAVAPQILLLGAGFGRLVVASFPLVVRSSNFALHGAPDIFNLHLVILVVAAGVSEQDLRLPDLLLGVQALGLGLRAHRGVLLHSFRFSVLQIFFDGVSRMVFHLLVVALDLVRSEVALLVIKIS